MLVLYYIPNYPAKCLILRRHDLSVKFCSRPSIPTDQWTHIQTQLLYKIFYSPVNPCVGCRGDTQQLIINI